MFALIACDSMGRRRAKRRVSKYVPENFCVWSMVVFRLYIYVSTCIENESEWKELKMKKKKKCKTAEKRTTKRKYTKSQKVNTRHNSSLSSSLVFGVLYFVYFVFRGRTASDERVATARRDKMNERPRKAKKKIKPGRNRNRNTGAKYFPKVIYWPNIFALFSLGIPKCMLVPCVFSHSTWSFFVWILFFGRRNRLFAADSLLCFYYSVQFFAHLNYFCALLCVCVCPFRVAREIFLFPKSEIQWARETDKCNIFNGHKSDLLKLHPWRAKRNEYCAREKSQQKSKNKTHKRIHV